MKAAGDAVERWERRDYLSDDELRCELAARIRAEIATLDGWLAGGEAYVLNQRSGIVHLPAWQHIRHAMDRAKAWEPYLEDISLMREPYDYSTPMPLILTRTQVESRRSYRTCPTCSPTLDHPRKTADGHLWRAMKASSLGHRHIGLDFRAANRTALGALVRVTSVIAAEGQAFTAEFDGGRAPVTDPDTQLEYRTRNGRSPEQAAG